MLHPHLTAKLASIGIDELLRAADHGRLRRTLTRTHRSPEAGGPITIRHANDADRNAIDRIAALDAKAAPAGRSVVALRGERMLAVVDIDTGQVIADPFERTAGAAAMARCYILAEHAAA